MDWREAQLGGNVGPGWAPVVDELHAKLVAIDPNVTVDQVKEKFGGLRYYFTPSPSVQYHELAPIVGEYEARCARTCEWCGSTENATVSGSWAKTLCPACRERWDSGERWWT